ncbi:ATP-binding protein [Streptomyces sp. DT24]|uniref:ATP-binding protein n=1 Tax=Streptomyces sp. DT24 TaxID=3416520 RepID=UPI003CFB65F3
MAVRRMEQVHYRRYRPAVKAARARARELSNEWGLPEVTDSVESAVSELVSNAVIHGRAGRGSRVRVTYRLYDGRLRVEVRDSATGIPRLPATAPFDELSEGGRGLALVAALSHRWGVVRRVIGKDVWFEMRLGSVPVDAPLTGDRP